MPGPPPSPAPTRSRTGDLYHALLVASWPRLMAIVAVLYLVGNLLFAAAYVVVPGGIENARAGSFADAFFFSVQTMATIGFGKMTPAGVVTNLLVTVEAFVGLIGLAMVTGLVFAKFSRPTARVLFSRSAVVASRDGVPCLMFRMANERGNNIVEAEIHVVLARNETTLEGEAVRRFHDLEMARRKSALFALSWTALHPITERSPLHRTTAASLAAGDGEVIVSLVGLDETFAQTVHARYVYRSGQIVWGGHFADVLVTRDGRRRIDYARFHDVLRDERKPGTA